MGHNQASSALLQGWTSRTISYDETSHWIVQRKTGAPKRFKSNYGFPEFQEHQFVYGPIVVFWLCNPLKRFRWSRSPRKWPDPWDSRSSAAGGEIGQLLQAELVYCINPISTRFQEWFKPVQASIFEGFWGYNGMIFRGMRNWCHGDLMLVNGMWMGFYIIKCQ